MNMVTSLVIALLGVTGGLNAQASTKITQNREQLIKFLTK